MVTVLLGAPPGSHGAPVVVPLGRRPARAAQQPLPGPAPGEQPGAHLGQALGDSLVSGPTRQGRRLDFDDTERRALLVLAQAGLVPPLRHRPPVRDAG
ncbi:hypothetical protein NH342_19710 [Klenkia sp. PcliD-1-E]|nr:hypothetical protein [Klenkia sp. PcliD-1-E]MCO7222033.1 hypothetical protein [Klenkia sp. PcliD-1-E]